MTPVSFILQASSPKLRQILSSFFSDYFDGSIKCMDVSGLSFDRIEGAHMMPNLVIAETPASPGDFPHNGFAVASSSPLDSAESLAGKLRTAGCDVVICDAHSSGFLPRLNMMVALTFPSDDVRPAIIFRLPAEQMPKPPAIESES